MSESHRLFTRRHAGVSLAGLAFLLILFLLATRVAAQPPDNSKRDFGMRTALQALNLRARAYGLANQAPPSEPSPMRADNFDVLGHNDLGNRDINGDVWIHGDYAYVGTWALPCTGRGVKIVDVSDVEAPRAIGSVAFRPGTSAEDVVVRHVSTDYFSGDLLATGIQRCGNQPALDRATFGVEFWDVSDPRNPRRLSELGLTHGGGGVHELDLFHRGDKVYALLAVPFREAFDPVPGGDFSIIDVTDPSNPVEVGSWGAITNGLADGPLDGLGSFGASFAHGARASVDGTKAYVSYWDLGTLTFDIRDVTSPSLVSQTQYPFGADGDGHSVSEYGGFLLHNDEDVDPRSPAHILYDSTVGLGNESPGGVPLLTAGPTIEADVVEVANQGCFPGDYPDSTAGNIAVVRTPFPFFDPGGGELPLCLQQQQEAAAEAAGAVAVVHDFISNATSPQWFDFGSVGIPVLFTDHETAEGMVLAGHATLEAQEASWGFLRVYDASSGEQVAKFDTIDNVHVLEPPVGDWTIHNNEVVENRSYVAWYSNGIVALDLTPLNEADPAEPIMVGQFKPPGARSPTPVIPSNVPNVWGVAIREDKVIFVSDMTSGLWIIRPRGDAAP